MNKNTTTETSATPAITVNSRLTNVEMANILFKIRFIKHISTKVIRNNH